MMRTKISKLMFSALLALIVLAPTTQASDALRTQALTFFKPLPATMPGSEKDSAELIRLGEELYCETALSINGTQSCNSCHRVDGNRAGVDNEPTSPGAEGKRGDRNSPSVMNAGFHIAQFWDGRAEDLTAQAKGPILNPIEMGLPNEATAIKKLTEDGYQNKFASVFPQQKQPLNYQNVAEAIAAFERTLITSDRFDLFLAGDNNALTPEEQQGLEDFINNGCIACHSGALLGGHMYQKMGLVNAYPNSHDQGRYAITGNTSDQFVFKVPSLRDISRTAPYFHDGRVASLTRAVEEMGYYQLGRKMPKATTDSIVAFLQALENQKPVKLLLQK